MPRAVPVKASPRSELTRLLNSEGRAKKPKLYRSLNELSNKCDKQTHLLRSIKPLTSIPALELDVTVLLVN